MVLEGREDSREGIRGPLVCKKSFRGAVTIEQG